MSWCSGIEPDDPDGNIVLIAEHGITREEFEDVPFNPILEFEVSSTSGSPCTCGYPHTGQRIVVIWKGADVNGTEIIIPVTAYEAEP